MISVSVCSGLAYVFFPALLLLFLRRYEQNSAVVFSAFFAVVVFGLLFCCPCVLGGALSVCGGSLVIGKVFAWRYSFLFLYIFFFCTIFLPL